MLHVACDIDGVVADFVGAAEGWVKANFGYDPVPADSWNWYLQWPDGKMVWRALWNKGCRNEHLLAKCKPVPGAVRTIQHMAKSGFQFTFVTHRKPEFHDDTVKWFKRYGLDGFPIVHEQDKSVVGGDVYVDDKADTVRALFAGGNRAFLFLQPWNASDIDVPTVYNWRDLEQRLRYIESVAA